MEKSKEESSLILELIKPGDSESTCKGLNFFAKHHQLHLPADGMLDQCAFSKEINVDKPQETGKVAPIKYRILFEKNHDSVKVSYALGVPMWDSTLIASFQVTVDGTDLIPESHPGKEFTGTKLHVLAHPDKDAIVSVLMTSNSAWSKDFKDILRGDRASDVISFTN